MKITISKLKQMLALWKNGNLKVIPKLELIFTEIKNSYKKARKVEDIKTIMVELIPKVNEFFIAGYEPVLCFLEDEYGYVPYNEKGWGDYYNEFSRIIDYIENNNIKGLRKDLKAKPLRRYEERYLGTFYDIPTKTLFLKDDIRVIKINKIADELNNKFDVMSLDQFDAKCKELIKIIYNK